MSTAVDETTVLGIVANVTLVQGDSRFLRDRTDDVRNLSPQRGRFYRSVTRQR